MEGEFDFDDDYYDSDHPRPPPPSWKDSFTSCNVESLIMRHNFGRSWGFELSEALRLKASDPITDREVDEYVSAIFCYGEDISWDAAYDALESCRQRHRRHIHEFFVSALQDCQLLFHHYPFQSHNFRPSFYQDLKELLGKLACDDEKVWRGLDELGPSFPKRDLLFAFLRVYMRALYRSIKYGWYNDKLPLEEYDGVYKLICLHGKDVSSIYVHSIDEARTIAQTHCARNIIVTVDKKSLMSGKPAKLSIVKLPVHEYQPPYCKNPDYILFTSRIDCLGYLSGEEEPLERHLVEAVWKKVAWTYFYGVTLLAYRWRDGHCRNVFFMIREFL